LMQLKLLRRSSEPRDFMTTQILEDPRGLFSPETMTWKIHSDPAMAVGGIRALLQQALHPVAMDGVARNSNFREDAWGRLQRTGDYVSTITFGERSAAQALAARVRKIHSSLGLDDPHLLLWVHMSMVDSFLDIARRSGIAISDLEADQYVSEMVIFAELVGVPKADVPTSTSEMLIYFQDIAPELSASDDAKRAALFLTIPPMPNAVRFATPAAPAWASLALLAASSLPQWARRLYGTPQIPGQGLITDISLKAVRSTLGVIPDALLAPPVYKEALVRWKSVAA
jgi:uncharacterized protein (DUF2236 family)